MQGLGWSVNDGLSKEPVGAQAAEESKLIKTEEDACSRRVMAYKSCTPLETEHDYAFKG